MRTVDYSSAVARIERRTPGFEAALSNLVTIIEAGGRPLPCVCGALADNELALLVHIRSAHALPLGRAFVG